MQTEVNNNIATESVNFKPNCRKPIYKFNAAGELVHTYSRITDAIKQERIALSKLNNLVSSSIPHKGHTFSMKIDKPSLYTQGDPLPAGEEQLPWESDNGMFDISGWGKVCF